MTVEYTGHRWHPLYVLFLVIKKVRIVPLVWIGLTVLGALNAPTFFNNLQDDLDAPKGSPSYKAAEAYYENGFPDIELEVIVMQTKDGSKVLKAHNGYVLSKLRTQEWTDGGFSWVDINGSYPSLVPFFLSGDEQTTVAFSPYAFDAKWFDNNLAVENEYPETLKVGASSFEAMDNTNSDAAKSDLAKMDAVSIPIALLVLAYRVRSLPLMIIPILVLPISLGISFGLLSSASHHTNFPSFSPALYTSTAIAMGFDWSLFLLTRFKEGVRRGLPHEVCVREMMMQTGPTVLMSGAALCVSYLALLLFPSEFIRAVGKGAAITLVSCVVVNLTFTPGLLLWVPCLWRSKISCRDGCRCEDAGRTDASGLGGKTPLLSDSGIGMQAQDFEPSRSDMSLSSVEEYPSPMPAAGRPNAAGMHYASYSAAQIPKQLQQQLLEQQRASWSYRLVSWVGDRPWTVIALVVILGMPLTVLSTQMKFTVDQNQLHPQSKEVYHTWKHYTKTFPNPGITMPYVLLTQATGSLSVGLVDTVIDTTNALISHLASTTKIDPKLFSGPTWLDGRPLNVSEVEMYLFNQHNVRTATQLGRLWNYRNVYPPAPTHFSGDELPTPSNPPTAFFTEIDTPFDPQGKEVGEFIRQVRSALKLPQFQKPNQVKFYLALGLTGMYDVKEKVMGSFPAIIAATVCVLLVVVAVSFRSLVGALRVVFTVGITLSWCYGGGVLIFQSAFLNHVSSSIADIDGIFWMGPVLTFSLVIGLALDYDIFLTARVREYRLRGYTDRAAVLKGYYRTGGVITTAGLIMVIAFGSLMLSSQMLLIQAGFFLSFSIFLDTFVVRSLLVPAIMIVLGRWNWWPANMPEPTVDENCMDDEQRHMES